MANRRSFIRRRSSKLCLQRCAGKRECAQDMVCKQEDISATHLRAHAEESRREHTFHMNNTRTRMLSTHQSTLSHQATNILNLTSETKSFITPPPKLLYLNSSCGLQNRLTSIYGKHHLLPRPQP